MALEDICNFKDQPMRQKRLIFSPFGDATTSIHMTDFHNVKCRQHLTSENNNGIPLHFFIPPAPYSAAFIDRSPSLFGFTNHSMNISMPFSLAHGTTTLGFTFQGGVIAAADTRASAGGLVASSDVNKITPIHSHLVVTSSGSGADCMIWERILIREIRLYQLRYRRRLSIYGAAKLLSCLMHPFKGTKLCVALTLCGWDKEEDTLKTSSVMTSQDVSTYSPSPKSGPRLIYVCSDGARLKGDIFSVGSGSPYAYGVLDRELRWSLTEEEAISLAREAVFRATHRDAYSGNNVDIFHITAQGWTRRKREDLKEEYYRDMEKRGGERIGKTQTGKTGN